MADQTSLARHLSVSGGIDMTVSELVEKASANLIGWAVVSTAGGIIWLIRRVFTNQKQIEMMQREFAVRDEQRGDDRRALQEVKDDVREIRKAVLKEGGS